MSFCGGRAYEYQRKYGTCLLYTSKQITLRMDGKDEDAIPYATYMTANSTKEISTLNDVKKRLGLETDEDSDSVTPTPTEAPDDSNNSNTDNPDPTTAPSDNNGNSSNNNPSSDDPTNSTIQTAEKDVYKRQEENGCERVSCGYFCNGR